MTDTRKTKRPGRAGRVQRDPRLESSPPAQAEEEVAAARRAPSTPEREGSRASMEADLERLRGERAAEADELADLLVRAAATERGRKAAEARVQELEARVKELEGTLADADALDRSRRESEGNARARSEELTVELAEARDRADGAAAELAQVQAGLEGLASDLVEARLRITGLEAVAEKARAAASDLETAREVAAAMREGAEAAEAAREELATRLGGAESFLADSQRALQESFARATAAEALAAGRATDLDRMRAELDDDRARIVDLETVLGRTRLSHRDAVEALTRKHDADALALEARRDEELAAARARHEGELSALRTRHEGDVAAAAAQHAARLKEVATEHTRELAATRQAHTTALRDAAGLLERERSSGARTRQQIVSLEKALAASRDALAKAGTLLDDLERGDAAALETRRQTLERARALMKSGATAPDRGAAPAGAPAGGATSLDDLDVKLPG